MGVANDRAISIPQITYDHIDDSVEKKDVSYFLEEPRGTVEGTHSDMDPAFHLQRKLTLRRRYPLDICGS